MNDSTTREAVEAMHQDVTDLVERMQKVYPNPSHALSVVANALGIMCAVATFPVTRDGDTPSLPTPESVLTNCCTYHSIAVQIALVEYQRGLREVIAELAKRGRSV